MSFNAKAIQIMIASPSDVPEERRTIVEAIYSWNNMNARSMGVVLLPVRWETHATPGLGDRGQALINKQCLNDSDIIIAVFGNRLGTPTGQFESGTVEEIHTALELKKEVMIYFPSEKRPLTRAEARSGEIQKVEAYKATVTGLYWEYDDCKHLKEEVIRHLTTKLHEMNVFHTQGEQPQSDLQDWMPAQPPLFDVLLNNTLSYTGDGAWLHIVADIGHRIEPFDSHAKARVSNLASRLYTTIYDSSPPIVERPINHPIYSTDYVCLHIPQDNSPVLRFEFKQDDKTGVFRIQFRNDQNQVPLDWIIKRLFVGSQELIENFDLIQIGFAISNLPSDGIATEPMFKCVIGGNRPGAYDKWCSVRKQPINLEESIKKFLYQFFDKWGYLGFEDHLASLKLR
jgi:hypothetical protein